jgi:predicted permease
MNDVRFALRQLLQRPGFTAVAILVLAFGAGVNTTIFSMVNAILVKPVHVPHPGQLVGLYQHERENPAIFSFFSYPDFEDLRSGQAGVFTNLCAVASVEAGYQGDFAETIKANLVSANYFAALGVAPMLGRGFLPEEEKSGEALAVLSHEFWTRLGADPAIIGRKLKLARADATVIGIMPPGFTGAELTGAQIYVPPGMMDRLFATSLDQPAPQLLSSRITRNFALVGRLKSGLTLANMAAPLANLTRQFESPDPGDPKPRDLVCGPPSRFGQSDRPFSAGSVLGPVAGFAFGLSGLVLGIACLNLANMMLARGASRRKEIALRMALGAGRRRIVRQLLLEGLLLALLGGAAGLLVSVWATKLVGNFIYSSGPISEIPKFDFSPDWRVLVVMVALSGLATLLFALAPALKLAAPDVMSDLKRGAGEDPGAQRSRLFGLRDALAVGQMAVALALLVAAGLFTRSAIRSATANPGFEFGANFFATIAPSLGGVPESRLRPLIGAAVDEFSAMPGVEAVSVAMSIPFGDGLWRRPVRRAGAAENETAPSDAAYNVVGAGYFRVMGIPLRRGREFDRREASDTNAAPVAIISQSLADKFWPGEDPLGRSIQIPGFGRVAGPPAMTVVGVVPDVRWELFEKKAPASVYVPFGLDFQPRLRLHVRVAPGANPVPLMAVARQTLLRLDPRMPVTEIKTLDDMHRHGPLVRIIQLGSLLFGAFGLLAALLSMLGIYGLKAYSVARRARELGIRMALGATGRSVVAMILRETAWLAGLGLALGLLLALGVGKLSGHFLYDVTALDPLTFGAASLLLFAVSMAAAFVPAGRAASVDPMVALRHE